MPSKSQAQRRKFAELLVAGKISPETFAEWSHVLWLIYTYHTDAVCSLRIVSQHANLRRVP
jgi:hypothetical protein